MEYEWNERKNRANMTKHGIDFEDARHIFDDPTVEYLDTRRDYGERRVIAIGVFDGEVMTVVYTLRGTARRIISARRANRNERRTYGEAQTRRPA